MNKTALYQYTINYQYQVSKSSNQSINQSIMYFRNNLMKKEITPSSSTLSSSSIGLFFFFTFFYIMTTTVLAFTIPTPTPSSNPTTNTYHHKQQRHCSSTVLYGRKKGKLLTQSILVQDKNEENEKSNTRSTFQKEDKEGVKVSSSLSQWIASQNGQDTEEDEEDEDDIRKNTNSKSPSPSPSTTENKKIQSILSSINEIISSNNFNIPSLLSLLSTLISHQQEDNKVNESFNTLLLKTNGKNVYNYKLVWVGSDDGICHLGTGLHKVPLARLQDVFMTIGETPIYNSSNNNNNNNDINSYIMEMKGSKKKKKKGKKKNKNNILNNGITVMEVIRILGPFPNVRNTLQGRIINGSSTRMSSSSSSGSSSSSSSNAFGNSIMDYSNSINNRNGNDIVGTNNNVKGHQVTIVYDSMMDGLGKEIKAGKDGDVRSVDLNILYADENVIVCVMPSTTKNDNETNDVDVNDDTKMFGANGENVLLFMKEDDLDAKLEGLRAA